ncbi:MAG: SOS response-associated peptidase [Actinomycetes bacterium]
MCGRYALNASQDELMDAFEISTGYAGPILPADWNITPTRDIYIVRDNREGQRELSTVSWGLIAPWSENSTDALRSQSQAINARTETVHEKPTFRSAFTSRRCLIPASGYYEWATEMGPYSPKQPFFIHGDGLIAFAGIWDRWRSPDGSYRESAAIITRPAVEFLATVHHRMPTFLPKDRWEAWLDPSLNQVDEIRALMNLTEPARGLQAYPVSSRVNSTANNGSQLIAPIELGEPETLF